MKIVSVQVHEEPIPRGDSPFRRTIEPIGVTVELTGDTDEIGPIARQIENGGTMNLNSLRSDSEGGRLVFEGGRTEVEQMLGRPVVADPA